MRRFSGVRRALTALLGGGGRDEEERDPEMAKADKNKKAGKDSKADAKAKKAAAKAAPGKSPAAKKPAAKKPEPKKADAKKPLKKPEPKKAAAKPAAKKPAAKKPEPKKAETAKAAKKAEPKKPEPKKAAAKPAAKPAAKKPEPKKPEPKKAAAKPAPAVPATKKPEPNKATAAKAAEPAPKKVAATAGKSVTQPAKPQPESKKSEPRKPEPKRVTAKLPPLRTINPLEPPANPDALIHGQKPYIARAGEDYMSEPQMEHFRRILRAWKIELMEEVDRTVHHMQDESASLPDPNDRATQEEEFALELRTRDRERKLIKKIDKTLDLIEQGEYGYCESCGVEIGIRRLEARPTATLCIDCKTLAEIKERQVGSAG
jgi:DnaK suppressor protein